MRAIISGVGSLAKLDSNGYVLGHKKIRPEFLVRSVTKTVRGVDYEAGVINVGVVYVNKRLVGKRVVLKLEVV